jgi:hypothetical protein
VPGICARASNQVSSAAVRAEAGESAEGVASRVGKEEEGWWCCRRRRCAQSPGKSHKSTIKFRLVHNCLMRLGWSGRGQEGEKSPKHQSNLSRHLEPHLILPITVGNRVSKHYTISGLGDCLLHFNSNFNSKAAETL